MASIISTKTSGGGGIAVTGDTSGIMQLASNDGTTAVTINASQNVGIGTSSPTAKLQANITSAGSNTIPLVVSNTSATTSTECSLGFSPFSDTSIITGSIGLLNQGSGAYSLKFSNWNGSANVERMRIDSSGNVLVGGSAITANGSLSILPNSSAGATNVIWNRASTTATSYPLDFRNGNSTVGYISYTNTAVAYVTSSDYRLKENIAPMTGALDTIAQLNPVTYTWKTDGSDGQGFIAHELQAVVPDCVTGEKDAVDAEGNPQYQGIDTSFLVATLTAAIQEQQAIITDLKARIEVLEGASA